MKYIILILTLLQINVLFGQVQYAEGYHNGYKAGYCYGDPSCIMEVTPVAPIPLVGESQHSYTDGYNRGFSEGTRDKNKPTNTSGSYSTSNESMNVYSNPAYIPKVDPFKPDYNFYMRAYDNAAKAQQQQQYYQQQQMLYQQYLAEKEYQQRVTYIDNIKTAYNRFPNKPDSIPEGFYEVFVTAQNDYRNKIKVYVKNNQITQYYWDNYYEATILSSTKIANGKAVIKIDAMGVQTGELEVYFMEYLNNPSKKYDPPMKPAFVVLYGTKKKAKKMDLYIGNVYLGKVSELFPESLPNYGEPGAISFYLKPGQYQITVRDKGAMNISYHIMHVLLQENQVAKYQIDAKR